MFWSGVTLLILMTATCCSGLDGQLVRTVTCHGSISNLICADGVIKLYDVRYGRTDSSFCRRTQHHKHMEKEHCLLPEAYRIMSNRCDGEKVCKVMVSDSVFPDPCPRISKYLDVTYTCLASQTVSTCDGFVQRLSCDKGVISVQKAKYGRTSGQFCSRGTTSQRAANVNCVAPNTFSILSQRCDRTSVCEVTASSKIFSDPCPGTTKYLNTSYTCLPAKKTISCEGSLTSLCCGNDLIRIYNANYGRRDSTICTDGRPAGQLTNTQCLLSTSTDIVAKWCKDKSSCEIMATNDVFTDPCFGTYKYLEVSYGCIRTSVTVTDH